MGGPKTPDATSAWNVEGSRGAENMFTQSGLAREEEEPSWEGASPWWDMGGTGWCNMKVLV